MWAVRAPCPYQRWRPGSPGRRPGGAARYREAPEPGLGPVSRRPDPAATSSRPAAAARGARARPRRPPHSQWREARAGRGGRRAGGWGERRPAAQSRLRRAARVE